MLSIANTGTGEIWLERMRQIKEKGWTAEHDDGHDKGELAEFSLMILNGAPADDYDDQDSWITKSYRHLSEKYADNPIRRLAIAGALIAAEIDRLNRAEKSAAAQG